MAASFDNQTIDCEEFFEALYKATCEEEVSKIVDNHSVFTNPSNWLPLGGDTSNFSTVKNQQSNPIAAIIEKITNSIDAILTKRCLEEGIEPKSEEAPNSMKEALERFFPNNNWDLDEFRRAQAQEIQILADGKGPKSKKHNYPTCVVIYDNGEGQPPERFEDTFLSLNKKNKVDILTAKGILVSP